MFLESVLRGLSNIITWVGCVSPWEQGIRVRLGKGVKRLEPGLYVRIPFVDKVFKQSTRRRVSSIPPQTVTTLDGRVITCVAAVGYCVSDLFKLYNTMEHPNDTINNEVMGLVSKYIGSTNLSDCSQVELERSVMCDLDLSKYGLEGAEFYLVSFAFTPRVYRLITGGVDAWGRDSLMSMDEAKDTPPI